MPIEKKSASSASASADNAAPGVSIMIPSGGSFSGIRSPRRRSRLATRSYTSRADRTSPTVVTIGSSTRTGPADDARRIAANCTSSSSGRRSSSRIPRSPRAGLVSASSGTTPARVSASISFSPPQSSTRMVTGSPCMASTIER